MPTHHGTRTSASTPRFLALLLASLLILTGCGSGQEEESSESGDGTHTVETAFGEVTIPDDPQQIVALEGAVGPLLSADITPVATADGNYEDSFLPDEYDQVQDLPIILTPDGWDYEQIASLEPDLLIGFVRAGQDQTISDESREEYERLSAIAPTVFILSEGSAQTKDASVEISNILGDSESAEDAKQTYEDKAAQIREDYGDVIEEKTFAAVDYYENETTVYTPISWIGGILNDIEAPLVTVAADVTNLNGVDLSSEQLTDLDSATVILHEQTLDGEPGAGAAELAEVPTFQQLPAVQEGHDYGIEYFFADRYETGLKVLEQLESILQEL